MIVASILRVITMYFFESPKYVGSLMIAWGIEAAIKEGVTNNKKGAEMRQQKTNTIKKIISWTLGLPSAILLLGELNDLSLWWIQLAAILTLTTILLWNGAFKEAR